jgi:hypothetical protein
MGSINVARNHFISIFVALAIPSAFGVIKCDIIDRLYSYQI